MIPVVQHVADAKQFSLPLLAFGLLIGTCLGGNITPIDASANIVAVSFLEKDGYKVTFPSYVRLGLFIYSLCRHSGSYCSLDDMGIKPRYTF